MNPHKQSKSSIIFNTCWLAGYKGATLEEISDALYDAGHHMPVEKRLEPMLKTRLRKGQFKKIKGRWCVEKPHTPPV